MKTLKQYLPEPKEDKVPVQARIPKSLYDKVDKKLMDEGISWTKLIEASLKMFVEGK